MLEKSGAAPGELLLWLALGVMCCCLSHGRDQTLQGACDALLLLAALLLTGASGAAMLTGCGGGGSGGNGGGSQPQTYTIGR